LIDCEDRRGDFAEHGADSVFLFEVIAAVAGDTLDLVTEVQIARLLDLLPLGRGDDLEEHLPKLLVVEGLVGDLFHVAADAKGRRRAGKQVKVGGAPVVLQGEQVIDSCHRSSPSSKISKPRSKCASFVPLIRVLPRRDAVFQPIPPRGLVFAV
jgi:hypothetical protein